jgi:hypothetical protein
MNYYYDYFYQRFGIRRGNQLLAPPMPVLELLDLPRSSILHYLADSQINVGPPSDEYLFRHITRPIMMAHVLEVGDAKGSPRRNAIAFQPLIRTYHIKNRRFKQMRDLAAATRDMNTLVVYNYSLINHLWRYARSLYSEYYKWWNTQAALWKNIDKLAGETDRQHFIVVKLPKILPSVQALQLASRTLSQRVIQLFNTPESLVLLEMWKWLGEERGTSVIASLKEENAARVNLIFEESGRWFVLNLAKLDSWRKTTEEEVALGHKANPKGIDPLQMQKRFLRMLMALFEIRTAPPSDEPILNAVEDKPEAGSITVKDSSAASAQPVVVSQPTGKATTAKDGTVQSKAQVKSMPAEARLPQHTPGKDDTAADIHISDEQQKKIDAELAMLEDISNRVVKEIEEAGHQVPVEVEPEAVTLEDGVKRVCDRLADNGLLSAAEYRRYNQLAQTYKQLPAPEGGQPLEKFIAIPHEELKIEQSPAIKDISTVVDKTMLKSSLHDFDRKYIKRVLPRDVAGMVLNIQRAGIAVTDYQVEHVEDVLGSYQAYTVRAIPVDGAASTLRFKLPVVQEDGTYTANGVKYRMRKQRGDVPIRKIAPDVVALTSYYGKVFVSRSDKRVNDQATWLRNAIMAKGLDEADSVVTNLHPGECFDNLFVCPRLYSTLAMGFRGFTLSPMQIPGITAKGRPAFDLSFDHTKREQLFGADVLKEYEKHGSVVVGKSTAQGRYVIVMDKDDALYIGENGRLTDIGTLEQLLGLDSEKAPVEFAELKVLGKNIPLAMVLGYEMGLERLMKLLGVTPRRVPAGTRASVDIDEYSVVFSDETLVFSKDDKKAAMILAGFNEYHRAIRSFSVYEFDKPGVYLNVLESNGLSVRYLREMDLLSQMFIDPITRDLLVEMKEPTNFRGLMMRASDMLLIDTHPDELDPAYQRIKGYERLAGAVYSEMIRSIRAHNGRAGKSRLPIDLNPYAVWKTISQDPSIALVSDINPIQNLKEQEAVTYSGVGGRSSRSMTKHTRSYHENDMGTISESTVDSSDVAINTYTSADPQFTSLRGMSRRYEIGKTGATALLSTSALVSPGATNDDPKRVNFIAIQHAHGVACDGYTQMAVRTGYEQVIAHRTSDLFALTAKKPGQVASVHADGMVIKYDDGEVKGIELGRRFGAAAGLTIPHTVKTEMREGQKFKEGDLLCYNDGFFERDLLNPNGVVWKAGILVKTVLMESTQTLEDSSAISKRIAKLLTTKTTKVKDVVVGFDQSVRKLVKVTDVLNSEDILCIIEDAVTENANLFDEESLDTLRVLSAQTPQAKTKGVVERIEVYYHGDKEDMSESLRAIAIASDRALAARCRAAGKRPFTGSVDEGFRIEGEPLALDTMAIRIYITSDVPAGVGDKGVFANQMKTVFGEVLAGPIVTESGEEVDAVFGQKSIADRIVLSPELIGTTTVLLDKIGKKALEAYRKG